MAVPMAAVAAMTAHTQPGAEPISTDTTAPYPSPSRAWTSVLILFATAVLAYTDRQVLSLLVDPVKNDLGITDTQISLLLGTAFAVIYGIVGIPLGILADRRSRRNLILAGVAIWSLGTIGCALTPSFAWLFAARIADRHGTTIAAVAARHVLDRPLVAAVVVGASHPRHLPDTLRIGTTRLTDADNAEIAAVLAQAEGPTGPVYALERDRNGRHGSIMKYNLGDAKA